MELVEKNILPVESSLKEAIIGEGTCRPDAEGRAQGFLPFDFLLGWGDRGAGQKPGKQLVSAWDSASGHRDQRHAKITKQQNFCHLHLWKLRGLFFYHRVGRRQGWYVQTCGDARN